MQLFVSGSKQVGSSLLEGTVRRPSDDERSRKIASKSADSEEALMSPTKRHLRERGDQSIEDSTSQTMKRKTREEIQGVTKKPKV